MSKKIMVWLLIAAIMIVSGGVIFAVAMILNGWDFNLLDTDELETNTHVIEANFEDIDIDVDEADVIFLPSDDGECRVVCVEKARLRHTVGVQNGVLILRENDEKQKVWYDYVGIFKQTPTVTVYLPKSTYGVLCMEGSTGDVQISKDFCFASVGISVSTADVSCAASCTGEVSIQVSTGDISLNAVTAASMTLKTTTGDVTLEGVSVQGELRVRVSSGETHVRGVDCGKLISTGSTGDVVLQSVIAQSAFEIERNTGDVSFWECDTAHFSIKTSTGDVTGTFLTPKKFCTDTSTGDVDIPVNSYGTDNKIETDTGDIRIEFLS